MCVENIFFKTKKLQMNSQVALMKCQDKKQLAKRNSSRQAVFINTSQPEDRVRLLMEDDSEDIYTTGTKIFRSLDWIAWCDLRSKPDTKTFDELDLDNLPLEANNNDNDDADEDEDEENEEK